MNRCIASIEFYKKKAIILQLCFLNFKQNVVLEGDNPFFCYKFSRGRI